MGDTIERALRRAGGTAESAYRYSFDMLGEAALTGADAERYFQNLLFGHPSNRARVRPVRTSQPVPASPLSSRHFIALRVRAVAAVCSN